MQAACIGIKPPPIDVILAAAGVIAGVGQMIDPDRGARHVAVKQFFLVWEQLLQYQQAVMHTFFVGAIDATIAMCRLGSATTSLFKNVTSLALFRHQIIAAFDEILNREFRRLHREMPEMVHIGMQEDAEIHAELLGSLRQAAENAVGTDLESPPHPNSDLPPELFANIHRCSKLGSGKGGWPQALSL